MIRIVLAAACIAAACYWSACQAPFSTDVSKNADSTQANLPADTGIDIVKGPLDSGRIDTVDTARGPVRVPPSDTVVRAGQDSGAIRGGDIAAVPVFSGDAAFARPVWFGALPGRSEAFLALEQYTGAVVLMRKTAGGWAKSTFLKLSVRGDGEMGLLGIAFHPRFASNRKYYVDYIPASGALATVIEEREADASLLQDAGKAPRQILKIAQPYQNHKGGTLAFGPKDGFLYVPTGDGGATVAGQDRDRLLGKVLRLDVDAPDSFRVPPDNPFVGQAGTRPEIWAFGLRNPWKWSFDPVTGELWVGDVGEEQREEIDIVKAGANLGWGWMEGNYCHQADQCGPSLQPPLIDFARDRLTCIIGGYVYRGDPASPWYGAYFFADYGTHAVWMLRRGADGKPSEVRELLTLPTAPSSFGTDEAGNLYVVGYGNGAIYRLQAASGAAAERGRL